MAEPHPAGRLDGHGPSRDRRPVAVAGLALVLGLAGVLSGCGAPTTGSAGSTTATPATTVVGVGSTNAPTDPSAGIPSGGPVRPSDAAGPYPVVQVVDGDTVKVRRDGEVVTLRLIGLDTPETKDPRKPVQCFGREASDHAHALLDGRSVWLTTDPTQDEVDRYGRTLAYLWLPDGQLFNWLMVWEGYAHEYTYDLPYAYQAENRAAERSAREAGRGLWASDTCAGDTDRPA